MCPKINESIHIKFILGSVSQIEITNTSNPKVKKSNINSKDYGYNIHNEGTVPGQEVVFSFFSPIRSDKVMKNEAH